MGYEQNDITAGRSALEARARAIEGISTTAANMNEAVSRNLQNVGSSIMQYAAFREQLDKNARDEAFRQKELGLKEKQLEQQQNQFDAEFNYKKYLYEDTGRDTALADIKYKKSAAAKNRSEAGAINLETKYYKTANEQIANAAKAAAEKAAAEKAAAEKAAAEKAAAGQGGTPPTNDNTKTGQGTNKKSLIGYFVPPVIANALEKKFTKNLAQTTEDTLKGNNENSVWKNG